MQDLQLFELQAYDSQDNVFSSLEGLVFDWGVEGMVQKVKFGNSYIDPGMVRNNLEKKGLEGDFVLIQG